MDPAGRGGSRAERLCRVGYRERLEDLRIRLSEKIRVQPGRGIRPMPDGQHYDEAEWSRETDLY